MEPVRPAAEAASPLYEPDAEGATPLPRPETAEQFARLFEENRIGKALVRAAGIGMEKGAVLGAAGQRALTAAKKNLIREADGIEYDETIRHGGVDLPATLLGIDPDKFGAMGKKAAKNEEDEGEKQEPSPGPGEPGGRPLTEEEAGEVEMEQQSLNDRLLRLLALFKGWKAARESELRKKRRREEEARREDGTSRRGRTSGKRPLNAGRFG